MLQPYKLGKININKEGQAEIIDFIEIDNEGIEIIAEKLLERNKCFTGDSVYQLSTSFTLNLSEKDKVELHNYQKKRFIEFEGIVMKNFQSFYKNLYKNDKKFKRLINDIVDNKGMKYLKKSYIEVMQSYGDLQLKANNENKPQDFNIYNEFLKYL